MLLYLSYLTDLLLVSASLGAAAYCMVLSRRLSRLGSFDKGIGSAIAVLSAQVEEMKAALGEAKAGSDGAGQHLNDLVRQAQDISAELEMMIAACHDFAETAIKVQGEQTVERGPTDAEVSADQDLAVTARSAETSRTQLGETAEHPRSDALPVFGSRRAAHHEANSADSVPMFRHRAGTGV